MRKSDPMEVVVHYPKTEEGWEELGKRVVTVHTTLYITVEGNSGDACKIKSYDLNYQCIKGYGLMNW